MPPVRQGALPFARLASIFQPQVACCLVLVDALMIALHVTASLAGWSNPALMLHVDQGWAETYQYAKASGIALLSFWMAGRPASVVMAAWGGLFTYIVVDDALSIHESYGRHLTRLLSFTDSFGLRAQDFGELAVLVCVGGVFVALLAVAYRLSSEWSRGVSQDLLALLVVLAFFGVVVDMLHIVVQSHGIRGFTIIEDGGELVTMSLMAAYLARAGADKAAASGRLARRLLPVPAR